MLYYIEPTLSDGRTMYAKSPFRKVSAKKRISQEIPKSLNMMPFAFADGNEPDNSSDSEDEAKPAILSIEKIAKREANEQDEDTQS